MVTQIEEVAGKDSISGSSDTMELNQKLTILKSTKKDEEIAQNLVKKLEDTEAALSSQQDRINSASSTIKDQSRQNKKRRR